ncbi:MAG: hypothetical protein ACD_62C00508G0002 [uncultured bacterium]|nr:MAG: hypothetical protein ACD_62C00508G0002 [uncultured bacterium]
MAANRFFWMSRVLCLRSFAASPGCGVSIQLSRLEAFFSSDNRLRASASTTSGSVVDRQVFNRLLAHLSCPRPHPMAMTLARAMSLIKSFSPEMPQAMISGRTTAISGACSGRVATETRPAPDRSAAVAQRQAAPIIPVLPPTTST